MPRMMRSCLIAVFGLGCCLSAHAATILEGEIVQFSFTLSGPPTCPDGTCDTLIMTPFGASSIFQGSPIMHVELFNGNTLLGTFTGVPVVAAFDSSTSLYTFDSPPTIDFSSILNGAIQGIVLYQLTGGSITNTTLDPASAGFGLGHATDSSGFNKLVPVTVTSETVVPEPSVSAFVLAGLAAMACWAGRRGFKLPESPA